MPGLARVRAALAVSRSMQSRAIAAVTGSFSMLTSNPRTPPSSTPPVESAWSHLKRSLANLAKRDIAQLTALVKTRLRRM